MLTGRVGHNFEWPHYMASMMRQSKICMEKMVPPPLTQGDSMGLLQIVAHSTILFAISTNATGVGQFVKRYLCRK